MASVGFVPESLRLLMSLLDNNQDQFDEGQYIQISNLLKSINDTISNNQINLQSLHISNSSSLLPIKIINSNNSNEMIIPQSNEKSRIDARFRLYMRTKGRVTCEDERIVLRDILQRVTIDRLRDKIYVLNFILPEDQLKKLFESQRNERCSYDPIYIKIKEDYIQLIPDSCYDIESGLDYDEVKIMLGDNSIN